MIIVYLLQNNQEIGLMQVKHLNKNIFFINILLKSVKTVFFMTNR